MIVLVYCAWLWIVCCQETNWESKAISQEWNGDDLDQGLKRDCKDVYASEQYLEKESAELGT